jgi:hypothetical protein
VHAPIGFVLALLFLFVALQLQARTPSSLTPEQHKAPANLTPDQQKAVGENLLAQLRNTLPVGRPVMELQAAVVAPGHPENDIGLRRGDTLTNVTVIGEVQNPTAHIWKRSLSRDDYLSLSDGAPTRAASMSSGLMAASFRQSLRAGSEQAIRTKGTPSWCR